MNNLSENDQSLKSFDTNSFSNYKIDYMQNYLSKFIKFIVNFLLIYIFIEFLFDNMESLSKLQIVLIICVYCSVLLYILDNIFPNYNIKL